MPDPGSHPHPAPGPNPTPAAREPTTAGAGSLGAGEGGPSTRAIKVLLIDDDRGEYLLLRNLLSKIERQQYDLSWVATFPEGQAALSRSDFDVFLVDYRLADRSGLELLREAKARHQVAPIILLTGQGDHQTDLEAMKAGAADYLVKGELNATLLERSIRYALERTRATQRLRESDERYRILVETSPDAIVCTNLSGMILLCNQMAVTSQGLSALEEMTGHSVLDFIAAEERPRAQQLLETTIRTGLARNVELVMVRADGSRYPVETSASCMMDASGRPHAVILDFRDMTERMRAEATVRKLSRAAEQTADHLFITDRAGTIEYVNPAFERLTGYRSVDVIGQTPRILKSGYHGEAFFRDLWNAILSGQVFRAAFTNRRQDGELYYEEQTITPIIDNQGQITHFVATGHDITQRKKAEEALRVTEAKYRSIFENAIEGIYQCAPDGLFMTANPALARMLGYESAEALIKCLSTGNHSLHVDAQRYQEFLRLVRDQDEVSNFESRVYRRDGKIIWISENARAVRDARGTVVHFEGTVENITQRKQAEQDMLRLAAFPQWNPNPVLEFSAEGNLSYFNRAAQSMVESLRLDHPQDMLPPHTPQLVRDCLQTGHNIIRREYAIGNRVFYWSFFPIVANQVIHCYVEDVTERLDLEARLRHSQKMESIGQLAAGVAHDFNNLLTIIQGQACLVLAKAKLDLRSESSLNHIISASERAANLTRQLLAFSRRQPMQAQPIHLNEVINNLAKMLQRILGDDILLEFNYSPNLPPIQADISMVEQIIMNLVVNARDAMPKGGRLIFRTSSLFVSDQYAQNHPEAQLGPCVCLSVTDTGCGMDEAVLARIFEPFFTTKEIGKGTGLGLATVYGIVKQHRGWLEVESQPRHGSTFKVFFPACAETQAQSPEGTGATEFEGGNETVMVVEDEPSLRSLIEEILTALGYHVILASSGVEALNSWREKQHPIQLLITDMVMPEGLSGRELADQLLSKIPNLKVVFISGYSVDLTAPGLNLQEGVNFLQKPFAPHVLARVVRDSLDGRSGASGTPANQS